MTPDYKAKHDQFSRPQIDALLAVIRDVHTQHADDLCWLDIDRIFLAAGLPVPDRTVGDKCAMLKNCERFIQTMCAGGKWQSYAELEAERDEYRRRWLSLIEPRNMPGLDAIEPPWIHGDRIVDGQP